MSYVYVMTVNHDQLAIIVNMAEKKSIKCLKMSNLPEIVTL
jgi:hypothetical protein